MYTAKKSNDYVLVKTVSKAGICDSLISSCWK